MPNSHQPADASAKMVYRKSVAKMLGCSVRHVDRLAAGHRMRAPIRFGMLLRRNRTSIEKWIADGYPATGKGVRS